MADESQDFSGITNPNTRARGARGNPVRLGKHLASIKAARYFKSGNTGNAPVCVVECSIEKTIQTGCFNGILTPEEVQLALDPNGHDMAHTEGETVAAVWKKDGAQAQVFDGNVKGFLLAGKQSLLNMIQGAKEAGHPEAADYAAYYASKGIDMDPSKRNDLTGTEVTAIFAEAPPTNKPEDAEKLQAFAGLSVYIVANRIKTKGKGIAINATAFDPVPTAEWKKNFLEALDAAKAA